MICYRITKYNPKYRNTEGHYLCDDWTSVADIGEIYNGKEITTSDYLLTEDKYFQAVKYFMDEMKLTELKIKGLERYDFASGLDENSDKLKEVYDRVKDGMTVKNPEIELVVKLILRDTLWAKLVSWDLEVHFGYDYYMYICSKDAPNQAIDQIIESGLFVEPFKSPYL